MSKETASNEMTARELVIKVKEWCFYLISRWKIFMLFGIVGATLGLGYSLLQKLTYTASLSFALEDDQKGGGFGGAISLASQFGFDISEGGGGIFSGSNLIELFKSRTMVEKTLLTAAGGNNKSISFAEMYIQNQNWRTKWNENPKFKSVEFLPNADRQLFTRIQDSILGVIYDDIATNSLNVSQKDKKIDIITIDVKFGNEIFAKTFTEALATEVSEFYVETRSKKSRLNLEILEKQTDSIRSELNAAISGVAVANDKIFGLNPAINVRRVPSARRQVDVQANSAILTELVKQTELAKVSLRKATPLIQIIDKPILPLKKERFGKLKGLIIGAFLGGIIGFLLVVINRLFKEVGTLEQNKS